MSGFKEGALQLRKIGRDDPLPSDVGFDKLLIDLDDKIYVVDENGNIIDTKPEIITSGNGIIISTSGTATVISLSSSGVLSGSYGYVNGLSAIIPKFVVDSYGRIVSASTFVFSSGDGTVKSIAISSTTLSASNTIVTSSGTIAVNLSAITTAGTHTKIVKDVYGRVTSGGVLTSADIPNLDTSKITTGGWNWSRISATPTALSAYGISASDKLFDNKYLSVSGTATSALSSTYATSAAKLKTPRTISISGDMSYSVLFDGSANVISGGTLATVNSSPGTFNNFIVNGKGLVTSARLLTSADIPNLDSSKITTGQWSWSRISATPTSLSGYGISASDALFDNKYLSVSGTATSALSSTYATSAAKLKTPRMISISGDVSYSVLFDGSADVISGGTLATVNSTVGTFNNFVVNGKGLVTSARLLTSADIPNLDATKIVSGQFDWSRISATPTSLSGYGISASDRLFDGKYLNVSATAVSALSSTYATSASLLVEPKTISISGDVLYSVLFDGSKNVISGGTLATVNLNPGTYNNIVVNGKGLVTSARLITSSDIPSIDSSKIISGQFDWNRISATPTSLSGYGISASDKLFDEKYLNVSATASSSLSASYATSASRLSEPKTISISGDLNYSVLFDGSSNVISGSTLATVNNSPGTYNNIVINEKGLVTSARYLTSADVPNIDSSKITTGDFSWSRIIDTPTSLSGYNISASDKLFDNKYLSVSGTALSALSAHQADVLSTPTTLSIGGDVEYVSSPFDGSSAVSGTAKLKEIRTSGTHGNTSAYPVISVDSSGRVVSGYNVKSGDRFKITSSKIISGVYNYTLQSDDPNHLMIDIAPNTGNANFQNASELYLSNGSDIGLEAPYLLLVNLFSSTGAFPSSGKISVNGSGFRKYYFNLEPSTSPRIASEFLWDGRQWIVLTPYFDATASSSKYTTTESVSIGINTFTISHNLGVDDVSVDVYDTDNNEKIIITPEYIDTDSLKLTVYSSKAYSAKITIRG